MFSRRFQDANPVSKACKDGDAEKLSKLLAKRCKYMFQDILGSSPMHAAARGGHLQCVNLLLQAAEKDSLSADEVIAKLCEVTKGETPLSIAAGKGHCEMVKVLATLYSKSTPRPNSGYALNIACENGNIECFHIILNRLPWLVDAREFNYSPLEHAAKFGSFQTLKLLVDAGADISERTENGARALHKAYAAGDYKMAKYLIDHGCAEKLWGHRKPLFAVAESPTGSADLVKLLLSRGADPCATLKDYCMFTKNLEVTPLAMAARRGNIEIVKILAGLANPTFSHVATFYAAFGNSEECLRYLFQQGFPTFTSTYFQRWAK